jgi:transketolase
MRDAFIRALSEITAQDPRVMLVNGDLGFGVLTDFMERFPQNYVNAGVAEQNMTAVACGMALAGARAYTYSIGNFPTMRCLEQIRNDVCYHGADVTVVSIGAGFSYGQLGVSHFATEDLAVLRAIPELTVVSPSDAWQAHALTHQLHALGGPSYLRLDKGAAGLSEVPIEIGRARTVRNGTDAVIFATGSILGEGFAAAHDLASEGRSVRVVDIHTLKPFDTESVCEAADACKTVVTLEEHVVNCGLGGAVAEACLEGGAAVTAFRRMGLPDVFPSIVGDQAWLRAHFGLDRTTVADTVRALLL